MIKGIENLEGYEAQAILSYIAEREDLTKDIIVESDKEDLIVINGKYFLLVEDPYDKLYYANEEAFNFERELNVKPSFYNYIDKEAWIDENGYNEYIDYLKDEYNSDIDDCGTYSEITFYEICRLSSSSKGNS